MPNNISENVIQKKKKYNFNVNLMLVTVLPRSPALFFVILMTPPGVEPLHVTRHHTSAHVFCGECVVSVFVSDERRVFEMLT